MTTKVPSGFRKYPCSILLSSIRAPAIAPSGFRPAPAAEPVP